VVNATPTVSRGRGSHIRRSCSRPFASIGRTDNWTPGKIDNVISDGFRNGIKNTDGGSIRMSGIQFYTDDRGFIQYRTDDKRMVALGVWLKMDIGGHPGLLLDALAMVDDVASGRSNAETWDGEGFEVQFSRDGVQVTGVYTDVNERYSLAEVRTVLEEHWGFVRATPENPEVQRLLRPDLPQWHAYLLQWESTWKRPHPYRGRLGIPAQGPA
jgi:hypothetical protein